MMQPADERNRDHLATVRWLRIACNRRVAGQEQVLSRVQIIAEVRSQNALKTASVENDDISKTLSADRTDQVFCVRVGLRRQMHPMALNRHDISALRIPSIH